MRRIAGTRPSPSLVISMLALFVALSGVAVALPGTNTVNSGDVVNNSLKSVDLKDNKGVKGADVVDNSLRGADINESSLGTVPSANIGRSPVAYAHVNADGTVDASQSRGVTNANVARELTSTYCFRGLGFAFKTAQVTADHGTAGGFTGVSVGIPGTFCTPDAQVEVFTDNASPRAFAPRPFYIWFYN